MRRFALCASALCLAAAAVVPAVNAAPAPTPSSDSSSAAAADRLAPLARFIGEWKVEGAWSSGEPLKARATYAWNGSDKFVEARTFVMKETGEEYQRYHSIMGWHPKKECLFQTSYAYDGSIGHAVFQPEGDTMKIGYVPFEGDETPSIRQSCRFTSADAFVWTVWMKNKEGGWDTLIEAEWERVR